jgi:aminoglycoside phosphotransferase (APT) family kinase protein
MKAACDIAGLETRGAHLLRLGENALFQLPEPRIVVRIARSMAYLPDAAREVAIARWLASDAFPAVRVSDIAQPVEAVGRPVTFWHWIDGRNGNRDDIETLALFLRRLHQRPRPVTFELPNENILSRVQGRLEKAAVSTGDRDFLQGLLQDVKAALPNLQFPLPPAVTHGDAHVQNLMVAADGPLLIDFERVAWGQPEWDLAMTATEYKTAGWWADAEYERFSEAYGFDVTSWSGFPVLQKVHEIKMVSWLAQMVDESPDIAREFEVRMRTIRGQRTERWQPF